MTDDAAAMLTVRLDAGLKASFVAAAERDAASASDVLRGLVTDYVRESRRRDLRRQMANIRANADDEREAMDWIATFGAARDD